MCQSQLLQKGTIITIRLQNVSCENDFCLDDNKNSYHRRSTWSSSKKSETRWTGQDRTDKEL